MVPLKMIISENISGTLGLYFLGTETFFLNTYFKMCPQATHCNNNKKRGFKSDVSSVSSSSIIVLQ